MGEIGIFNEDKSNWIQFDSDTEVQIKLVGKEELRKIQRKAEKTAQLAGIDVSDIADQKLGRAAVLGWRKIKDHNHPGLIVSGEAFPYTPENIDLLMKKSLAFSGFVNDHSINERDFLDKEEADTKNA